MLCKAKFGSTPTKVNRHLRSISHQVRTGENKEIAKALQPGLGPSYDPRETIKADIMKSLMMGRTYEDMFVNAATTQATVIMEVLVLNKKLFQDTEVELRKHLPAIEKKKEELAEIRKR